MTEATRTNQWRLLGWGAAGALLLLPAVAMRFTDEVNWTGSDFAMFGGLLLAAGLGYEFLVRRGGGAAYRAGAAVAVIASFLLVWMNLAVGIIGSEDNDANMMFAAVLATVVGGACIAHGRAGGMVRTMLVATVVQAAIGVIALAGNLGTDGRAWPRDVIVLTLIYVALWIGSAGLFARAARG